MGLPTLFIGLLPTYTTANMAAPILLIILRIIQGFACGAEFIGSVIYLGEHVPCSKKTFWCSFAWVGSLSGTLLGLLVFTLLTGIMDQGDLNKWGWRIPFILGGFALFVAFWFRRHAQETPEFIAYKNKRPNYLTAVSDIKLFKIEVIAIALMSVQIAVMTYFIIIFLPTYLNVFLNYPKKQAALLTLAMTISILILTPVLSKIIDNAKIKYPIYYASLFNFLLAYPTFRLIESHVHFKLLLGLCVLILMCSSTIITFPPLFLKAAPVNVRFRVISIPYNLVISLFGGTLPLLMSYFIHASNNISFPSYYLMFSSAISFYGSILLIRRISLGGANSSE